VPAGVVRSYLFADLRDYTVFVETQGDSATARLLRAYRGVVRTEVALIAASGRPLQFVVRSTVGMKPADDAAIRAYVATGEPLDRAGAYAIQGGGAERVAWYDGCYANIVGLPLCHVFFGLRKLGLGVSERPEPAFIRAFGFECPAWSIACTQGRQLRNDADYATQREAAT